MGDANASIPTPEPLMNRPMFAAQSAAAAGPVSIAFVSRRAAEAKVSPVSFLQRLWPRDSAVDGVHQGAACNGCSALFLLDSDAVLHVQVGESYGLKKRVEAVQNCRSVTKADMRLNSNTPKIEVDPEKYIVTADGVALTCEPASTLPLTQNYFLF